MQMELSENILAILSLITVLLPLLSFVLSLSGRKLFAQNLSLAGISAGFVCSAIIFLSVWNRGDHHLQVSWFSVGQVELTAGLLLNNLSALMLVLVSGIGLLVHVYSISYMKGDPGISRYWAYLSLFCFSMLALVVADSLLLVYMFWELVGFSSYLLIGFWFDRDTAARASRKAFLVNRIGDLGFLAGLMIIYTQFGTFDLIRLFGNEGLVNAANITNGIWVGAAGESPAVWVSVAGLAFFLGAMAKSAQFPLQVWLPDAMEGPTSVSSLIHAATMVAAGVFLLGRVFPLFDMLTLNVIVTIGTLTAVMAATIALTQNDIKRILAYSTISQLGFMMAGMGMGLYAGSIFHLATHAFFKCLLFLCAGSVIHQMQHYKDRSGLDFDHQDIRFMGGLRQKMPVTFVTMVVAASALAGLPFTSGFLSKDALLIGSFEWSAGYHGFKKLIPYLLVLSSWMTTFYIFRLIFKVFFGEFRYREIHESPGLMRWPMLVLALLSSFIFFSLNPFSSAAAWIHQGFQHSGIHYFAHFHALVPSIVTIVSVGIIFLAYRVYVTYKGDFFRNKGWLYHFSLNGWYIDKAYQTLGILTVRRLSAAVFKFDIKVVDGIVNLFGWITRQLSAISAWLDKHIVDGLVNSLAAVAGLIGNFARRFQSGRVQHYFITMLVATIAFFLIAYFV